MIILETEDEPPMPREVQNWVNERNALYPKIVFKVSVRAPHRTLTATFAEQAQIYKKMYAFDKSYPSVRSVIFPYPHEEWSVRIVGGLNANNEITDDFSPESLQFPLPAKLRGEIANIPPLQELETLPLEPHVETARMGERR